MGAESSSRKLSYARTATIINPAGAAPERRERKSTILKLSIKHSTKRFARGFRVATSTVGPLRPLHPLPPLFPASSLAPANLLKYVKPCNLFNLHRDAWESRSLFPRIAMKSGRSSSY